MPDGLVTRFAMAQREIGLAAGEPPTTKGYTPTVFTELPHLLERAGPGVGQGTITASSPCWSTATTTTSRSPTPCAASSTATSSWSAPSPSAGRFPAINVLKSISRTMPRACDPAWRRWSARARQALSAYADMEELIRIGAYRAGSSQEVDEAVALMPHLEAFLGQGKEEATSIGDGYERLGQIVGRA